MNPEISKIAVEMQRLCESSLPQLLRRGLGLISDIPKPKSRIGHQVCTALVHRMALLLDDICNSFVHNLLGGYFTTAILTRGVMETASVLFVLLRDKDDSRLHAYLAAGEANAEIRLKGIQGMVNSTNTLVANAAKSEVKQAKAMVETMAAIRTAAGIKGMPGKFPNVFERCAELGDSWQFHYHALYRELSEAVHTSMAKIPHSPPMALRSENQGGAIVYEHCRAFTFAVEYWGISILETCASQPNHQAVVEFRDEIGRFLAEAEKIQSAFDGIPLCHQFIF